jgi:hypothetical protein
VAITKTPLSALAKPERKRIAKAVERGRAVGDVSDAEMAVTYATWVLRRYRIVVIMWFVLGGVSLFNTVQHRSQSIATDAFTAWAIVAFFAYSLLERLALRSLNRNQALMQRSTVLPPCGDTETKSAGQHGSGSPKGSGRS